jgi:hypothetical protein
MTWSFSVALAGADLPLANLGPPTVTCQPPVTGREKPSDELQVASSCNTGQV